MSPSSFAVFLPFIKSWAHGQVEIQVELEELEEEIAVQDQELFELDPFDTVVGQDEQESDSDDGEDEDGNLSDLSSDAGDMDDDPEDTNNTSVNVLHINEMVKKLDAILKLMFDHFNRTYTVNPSQPSSLRSDSPSSLANSIELLHPSSPIPSWPDKALRRSQFHILLSIFDRIIICTFKSRYTQFLVFWYSSLDPEFTDLFQGMLISKALLEPNQPAVTRAAAASYIASFVSRAQFVDRNAARNVMSVLCKFLQNQLDTFDTASQSGASVAHYSVFYAVSQAVFLIFCFRWRDLLEDVHEDYSDEISVGSVKPARKWMAELGIVQRMVTSPLNPLKVLYSFPSDRFRAHCLQVCSVNVVKQFARVAHSTDFIYCYSLMESNKRSEYAFNSSDAHSSRSHQPTIYPGVLDNSLNAELNTFFPFDPYRLPRSYSYIQSVYREWSAVALDEEDDEDEGDEDEAVDYDGEKVGGDVRYRGLSIRPRDDDTGLGASLGAMSISPGRPSTQSMSVS
jgi:RNA polymerase I-specific transcription initiation factor RRN3